MRATEQAAWVRLPRRAGAAVVIGAASTAIPLTDLEGAIVALVADAATRIVASNVAAAPTAIATDFPLVADVPVYFKIAAGDQLAGIGAANLDIFIVG